MTTAILIVAGYLAGSMPFGYWVVRAFKHVDIRSVGSGNIGATNVWRTYGRWYGVPVVLLDVLKGFVPAFVATLTVGHLAGVLAGGAAMLGHARPIFLKFAKGGKMVATCGGVFFGVAPLVALDVYEHAYFLDFQTDRAAYIETFLANLDWSVVNDWAGRTGIPK